MPWQMDQHIWHDIAAWLWYWPTNPALFSNQNAIEKRPKMQHLYFDLSQTEYGQFVADNWQINFHKRHYASFEYRLHLSASLLQSQFHRYFLHQDLKLKLHYSPALNHVVHNHYTPCCLHQSNLSQGLNQVLDNTTAGINYKQMVLARAAILDQS